GVSLAAGATMGAGSASASTATPSAPAATKSAAEQAPWHGNGDRVAGYFRSERDCERTGRLGEFRNRWDDYDCDRVRFGPRRGWVVLTVSDDDRWGGGHGGGNGGGNGPWGHGPRR
ncbi:hypothetical protein ACWKSP_39350, partial [Micromonosporaceae bacterium Da 78-11]